MRCQTCGTETVPTYTHCPTCGTPLGTPALSPGMPTYGVRGIGLAASVAVGATMALYLLTALFPAVGAMLARRAAAAGDADLLRRVLVAEGLLGLPFLLAYLIAAALVMIWLFRARKNTDAFPGVHPELNAHWAISGWWVPLANLVVPCKVMAGVVRDSLGRTRTPALVGVWWAAWLVYGVADTFAGFATESYDPSVDSVGRFQDAADRYQGALLPGLLPAVACLVAGIALIMLIQRISTAQQDRIAAGTTPWSGWPGATGPVSPGGPAPTVASPQVPGAAGGTIGA